MATKEQIWSAADALSDENKNPTLAAVRERLGGGSYTDISAAMQTWRTTQQAVSTIRDPAPSSIADRLSEFGSELWGMALELANARLQSEREALEQARQEAEETRKEAASLADSLTTELDKAQADIAALSQQLAASIEKQGQQLATIEASTAAITKATHRAELAEVARAELQIRTDQTSELLKQEQAANIANKAQQRADTDKAKAEATANAERLIRGQNEAEHARVAEQACQARLETAAREIEGLKTQVKEERDGAKKATETAAELKGRLLMLEEILAKQTEQKSVVKAPVKRKSQNEN